MPNTATAKGTGGRPAVEVTDTDYHLVDLTLVVITPEIKIEKDGPQEAQVGDTITYTMDVSVPIDVPLTNVSVSDPKCDQAPTLQSKTGGDDDAILEFGEVWHYTCPHKVLASDPDPLPRLDVDEPVLRMTFGPNSSPQAGKDGSYVTSRHIRDRLAREVLGNVAIRIEDTETPDVLQVAGRGRCAGQFVVDDEVIVRRDPRRHGGGEDVAALRRQGHVVVRDVPIGPSLERRAVPRHHVRPAADHGVQAEGVRLPAAQHPRAGRVEPRCQRAELTAGVVLADRRSAEIVAVINHHRSDVVMRVNDD